MKKAFFAALAALAVLAVVGCPAGTDPVEYTADGRRLVNVTIDPKPSRALTTYLASRAADYYEVVFYDGTDYYRTSWDYTKSGKIRVPLGSYPVPPATPGPGAILFAGYSSDNTLLAVGSITSPSGGTITATTTSLVFTMTALQTDVNNDPATSSFIQTPSAPASIPTADLNGEQIPIFIVSGGATSTAKFTIGPAGAAGFAAYLNGIRVATGGGTTSFAGIVSKDKISGSDIKPATLTTASITAPAGGAVMVSDILFSITAPNEIGLAKLAFQLPVCAINSAANGITWYIRGGLLNGDLDGGKTKNSPGGAILLGVGNIGGFDISLTGDIIKP